MNDGVRSRYTNFYLTMLILSTIGTFFGGLSVFSLPSTIALLEESRLYGGLSLVLSAVWLVSVVALVLLWKKHPLGIQLKLSCYVVSILVTVGLVLSSAPIIELLTSDIETELARSNPQNLSPEAAGDVARSAYYLSLSFSVTISTAFFWLWRKAWQLQEVFDQTQK